MTGRRFEETELCGRNTAHSLTKSMLSEKAKGKQRAVELPDSPYTPESVEEVSRDLFIRFTEGIPDLLLNVSQKDTIRIVKNNVSNLSSTLLL